MTAADGHAEVDRQLAAARHAESQGALALALQLVTAAGDRLRADGRPSQYVLEWRAQLEAGLGDHARAESSLWDGRRLAELAGHRPGMFRMDLLRAHNTSRSGDRAAAEQLLAGLRGDGGALGAPVPERLEEICRWLRALSFQDRRGQSMAALRAETALIIAEAWAARGRYRSAHRLVSELRVELCHASASGATIDLQQVRLREAEWLLAAGRLRDAEAKLAQIAPPRDPIARIRVELVATRLALAADRVADALRACAGLVPPPGVPSLFAAVVTTQVAVRIELNQLQDAQDIATAAIDRLAHDPRLRPLVDALMRVRADAAARGRSAMARWELPFRSRVGPAHGDDTGAAWGASPPLPDDDSSFSSAWTATANRILLALEAGDLEQAAEQQVALEQLTHGVESDSVAAHVALSRTLVTYYQRGPSGELVDELAAIATTFEQIGCRLPAARAARFAAWAAARVGRSHAHLQLGRRAATAIDAVAGELGAAERLQFLMNKWNGRDELAAAVMRSLLDHGAARPPGRRALCRAFRTIDALTHWPIEDALGDPRARAVASASRDVVARWVEDQRVLRAGRRGPFRLRSVLGLWRIPRRTLVLHYHMLGDRTYVFRIAWGHIDLRVQPIGRLQLPDSASHRMIDHEALGELAARCGITEALDDFPGIRRLVIIPHDALANVPFAALPVDGRPLCTRVAIAQLDRLSRLRRPPGRCSAGQFVAIGLDDYAGSGYCDLYEAEGEAAAIARSTRGPSQLLVGEDATVANALASLPGARGAHIAAHGAFDARCPDEAGVVLRDHGAHRVLTLRELQRLDLRGLDLVTLTTCRAAAHATLPGRERICVPTALLDAGVRGVIGSLWPVDDRTSAAVMSALYEHLRFLPPSIALARTQAALVDRPLLDWAGLVFYGND